MQPSLKAGQNNGLKTMQQKVASATQIEAAVPEKNRMCMQPVFHWPESGALPGPESDVSFQA